MSGGRAAPRVQVMIFAASPDGPDAITQAYHGISRDLDGTPGLLRNALLERVDRPGSFVVLSEWESLDAFRAWEDGPAHRTTTSPLRPYQDHSRGESFGIYSVAAEYSG
jgi:heme-degrading monooxygenase HmoA